jgi:uncharacterized protein
VRISYDPAKRQQNLAKHGLDFADAEEVFGGSVVTLLDQRRDYGEPRYRTFGYLRGRLVVLAWTPRRDQERRIISMQKANGREQARVSERFSASGRDDG